MIDGPGEAFLSEGAAASFGLDVGDTLPLAFWVSGYQGDNSDTGSQDVVEPLGRTTAEVVGVGVFFDEVLVDELYPRQLVVVSPDVAAPYDCTYHHPEADDPRPLDELAADVIPPDCAMSYQYFSLRVEGGAAGVPAVNEAMFDLFEEATDQLPAALRAEDLGFAVIPSVTSEETARVARSIEPAVTALRVFAVGAGISCVVLALLVALRTARRRQPEVAVWDDLGIGSWTRTTVLALPLALAALAGLTLAVLVGWVASDLGPVGSVAALDPAGHFGLDTAGTLRLLAIAATVLLVGIAVTSAVVARGSRQPAAPAVGARIRVVAAAPPAVGRGVAAALDGVGAWVVLCAAIATVVTVVTATVFAASIGHLLSRPAAYGWPYDVGVMVGFGYGGVDEDAVAEAMDDPAIERWGLAAIGQVAIDGRLLPSVADRGDLLGLGLPVVEGALPLADGEVAVGATTAAELDLEVDDEVTLESDFGTVEATISGVVVLPPLGAFEADRVALGTGVLLSKSVTDDMLTAGEIAAGAAPGDFTHGLSTFVAIDLVDGAEASAVLAGLTDGLGTFDRNGFDPLVYTAPIRPALVAELDSMRRLPVALGLVVATAMAAGLFVAITVATRARRLELAVLAALGCTTADLRSSIRAHAFTVVLVGVVVGLPLGLAAGNVAYRAFATGIGVVPEPFTPIAAMAVIVVAAVLIGSAAAVAASRRLGGHALADALRVG